jgi:hypothetical protein
MVVLRVFVRRYKSIRYVLPGMNDVIITKRVHRVNKHLAAISLAPRVDAGHDLSALLCRQRNCIRHLEGEDVVVVSKVARRCRQTKVVPVGQVHLWNVRTGL